jgi:AcrR family transcriptional regulator
MTSDADANTGADATADTAADKAAPSLRARVRAEMTAEIKRVALDHLAADGSALSLRAVARDMGMVSSALYRYFPSRDELLTALIIDAYDSLGVAAEEADAAFSDRGEGAGRAGRAEPSDRADRADRADFAGRWLAVGHAIRAWAVAKPHEYALIYGSPIPGYTAPQNTVPPANRPMVVLARIVADAQAADGLASAANDRPSAQLHPELTQIADFLNTHTDPAGTARFLTAATHLFGAISFEVFGRLNNVFTDRVGWYDWQLRSMTAYLGLVHNK